MVKKLIIQEMLVDFRISHLKENISKFFWVISKKTVRAFRKATIGFSIR
jgi:hypothetical protein